MYEENMHQESHEETMKPYECKLCKTRFTHKPSLRLHLNHHKTSKCPVENCSQLFGSHDSLLSHLSFHIESGCSSEMSAVNNFIDSQARSEFSIDTLLTNYIVFLMKNKRNKTRVDTHNVVRSCLDAVVEAVAEFSIFEKGLTGVSTFNLSKLCLLSTNRSKDILEYIIRSNFQNKSTTNAYLCSLCKNAFTSTSMLICHMKKDHKVKLKFISPASIALTNMTILTHVTLQYAGIYILH